MKPPGPRRAGHPTHHGLARNGDLVATSYVKTPYPHYREGIAVYSLASGTWNTYEGADFHYVWSTALAPDSTAIACTIEWDWSEPRQLVLVARETGRVRVLIERFNGSGPVAWAPDGLRIAYVHNVPSKPPAEPQPEIRVLNLETGGDIRFADGTWPSWSPSGNWIVYSNEGVYFKARPDGSDRAELVRPRRVWPWFGTRRFVDPAVWSPDGRSVLLNSPLDDETGRVRVYELGLETGALQRKTGAGPEALGWSR